MKIKIFLICGGLFVTQQSFSQSTTATNTYVSGRYLGRNSSNGVFPLPFKTNNINRMKVNGNLNYTIDGYTGARNGYVLIGENNTTLYQNNFGAYSRLHINGETGVVQQGGYRPWMKTGITLTDNLDLSYFGLRQVGTGTDVTETTMIFSY